MKHIFLYLSIFFSATIYAQIGGTTVYRFLDLAVPARSNALGNASIAIWDKDVNLGYANPALLNPNCSKQLAFNYVNYIADLNYGNFLYAHEAKKYGTFAAGLQFFNYGKFDGRDDYDIQTGTVKAADYSLQLSLAKAMNADSTLSLGVSLKTIYSHYASYSSFGNAIDVGLTYHDKKQLTISLVAKNYGKQWMSFDDGSPKEKLPTNVQFGISKKIPHAPFRLILQYDYLLTWDLTYVNPLEPDDNIDPFTNKPIEKSKQEIRRENINSGFDKFFRHITLGSEIILTENFMIRVAYNFRKGKEMVLPERKPLNGLSIGIGFKVNKFHLNYAFSKHALSGNAHTIGITTNLNYFKKSH